MAGVQVTFGANITELVEGIDSSINELRRFAEAIGAMYLADKTAEFIAQFGDMGEKIERAAAILGTSVVVEQELGVVSQLAGTQQDMLTKAVERLQINLQHAINPTSQQAQALRALGLSAQQLLALPIPEQINLMADAFKKLHDQGINPTSLGMVLMGRGAIELAPELERGRAGLEEMRQSAVNAGAIMIGETVAALAEMKRSATLLEASLKSLGGTIMGEVAPAITEFDNELAHSAGNMTALIATGGIVKYTVDAISNAVATAVGYLKLFGTMWLDIETLQFGSIAGDWKRINDEIEATANEGLNDLDAQLAKAREQYKALLDEAEQANKSLKPPPGGIDKDALRAEMEALQAMVQAQNAYYNQQAEHINSLAKTFAIGEQQKVQMLLAAVNQREAFQTAELQQAMSLQGLTAAQYQKFQDELTKIQQKATADRQKINDQAVQEYAKQWQTGLDTITSAFNSQLRGLLAGTMTWSQAWRKMLGDMIIKFIEMCEQMVVKWLVAQLAQTTAATTGAAARASAETAGANAGVLANAASALKNIMIDAGQAFAGVFAFLAPVMGPAAAGPAAAAQASVSAAAIFDVGTDYVVRGGLALIHPGETIIPAAKGSGPYTGGMGAPQVHAPVSINVAALDSQSVARFFNDNSKHMLRAINDAVKRGAHLGLRQSGARF